MLQDILQPPHWKNGCYPEGEDDYPVVNVSLEYAMNYAAWLGHRKGCQQSLNGKKQPEVLMEEFSLGEIFGKQILQI